MSHPFPQPLPSDKNVKGFSWHTLFWAFSLAASNVLQLEIVKKAVEMGYDPDRVQRLVLEKLRQSSKGYSTVEDLIRDLYNGVGEDVSAMSLESKSK